MCRNVVCTTNRARKLCLQGYLLSLTFSTVHFLDSEAGCPNRSHWAWILVPRPAGIANLFYSWMQGPRKGSVAIISNPHHAQTEGFLEEVHRPKPRSGLNPAPKLAAWPGAGHSTPLSLRLSMGKMRHLGNKIFLYLFIYLAVMGLSCGIWDPHCIMRNLWLWWAGSLIVAWGLP